MFGDDIANPSAYALRPPGSETEYLLELETGDPEPQVGSGMTSAAVLASTICKHGKQLTPFQIEAAICWLKDWKFKKLSRDSAETNNFFPVLQAIKEGKDQLEFMRRAHGCVMKGMFLSALCGAAAIGFCLAGAAFWLLADSIRWYWVVAFLIVTVSIVSFIFSRSHKLHVGGIEQYKRQESKYLLSCIRKAKTVGQLDMAGLFMYLDGTAPFNDHEKYDEDRAELAVHRETERLKDALYADFETPYRDVYASK
jgi:hypothetical protein